MSLTLTFKNVNLTPMDCGDNELWFTSSDLAKALGYKQSRAVTKLYNKRNDEFSPSMTKLVEVPEMGTSAENKGLRVKTRVFNLRGCHLIAMFARTKVAKDFRVWVLNVLDDEIQRANNERNSVMFQYNEVCGVINSIDARLSNAGRDLRYLGQVAKPEYLLKAKLLENKLQPQLPFNELSA